MIKYLSALLVVISACSVQGKFSKGNCLSIPVIEKIDLDRVTRFISIE